MPKRSGREEGGADDEERPRRFTRREDEAGPSQSSEPPTVGQQTSYIKNKLARSEMYSKLKHKQKVRAAAAGGGSLSTCPSCCCTIRCMQPRALPCCVAVQKQKRTERKKRQAEHAKAEREGLEPPPKQVPKVRNHVMLMAMQSHAAMLTSWQAAILSSTGAAAPAALFPWHSVQRPPPRAAPQTIENTREKDETMVQADDEEVAADEEQDEFAGAGSAAGGQGWKGHWKRQLGALEQRQQPAQVLHAQAVFATKVLRDPCQGINCQRHLAHALLTPVAINGGGVYNLPAACRLPCSHTDHPTPAPSPAPPLPPVQRTSKTSGLPRCWSRPASSPQRSCTLFYRRCW